MNGSAKDQCPPTGTLFYIDVRDIALAHILAVEKAEAGGKRFFITRGPFCNKEIAEIIAEEFPELSANLPTGEALKPGDYPEGGPKYQADNRRSVEVLGMTYRTLRECVVDTVKSLQAFKNK
jgi:nucleoside-diphosphate-sugar epimerase